jgi:hypothetical protein
MNAVTDNNNAALRARPGQIPAPALLADVPSAAPATNEMDPSAPTGVIVPPVAMPDDPDAAPASAPPKSKTPPPSEGPVKGKDRESENGLSKVEGDDAVALRTNGDVSMNGSETGTMMNGHLL